MHAGIYMESIAEFPPADVQLLHTGFQYSGPGGRGEGDESRFCSCHYSI